MTKTVSHPNQQSPMNNQLINGGFRIWQRGTSFSSLPEFSYGPDMWQARTNDPNETLDVSQVTDSKFGDFAMNVLDDNSTDNERMQQSFLDDVTIFQGKTLTASAYIKQGQNNPSSFAGIQIVDEDDAGDIDSTVNQTATNSFISIGSSFSRVTVSHQVASNAQSIGLQLFPASSSETGPDSSATGDAIFDGVTLVVGEFPVDYPEVVRPIGQEQSLAERYYEYQTQDGSVWADRRPVYQVNGLPRTTYWEDFSTVKASIPTVTLTGMGIVKIATDNGSSTGDDPSNWNLNNLGFNRRGGVFQFERSSDTTLENVRIDHDWEAEVT